MVGRCDGWEVCYLCPLLSLPGDSILCTHDGAGREQRLCPSVLPFPVCV